MSPADDDCLPAFLCARPPGRSPHALCARQSSPGWGRFFPSSGALSNGSGNSRNRKLASVPQGRDVGLLRDR